MLQGEHSAILTSVIKLPFVVKICVLSIFEWPFYTGFTVLELSSWCHVAVIGMCLSLTSLSVGLQCANVAFLGYTHLLFYHYLDRKEDLYIFTTMSGYVLFCWFLFYKCYAHTCRSYWHFRCRILQRLD